MGVDGTVKKEEEILEKKKKKLLSTWIYIFD